MFAVFVLTIKTGFIYVNVKMIINYLSNTQFDLGSPLKIIKLGAKMIYVNYILCVIIALEIVSLCCNNIADVVLSKKIV